MASRPIRHPESRLLPALPRPTHLPLHLRLVQTSQYRRPQPPQHSSLLRLVLPRRRLGPQFRRPPHPTPHVPEPPPHNPAQHPMVAAG